MARALPLVIAAAAVGLLIAAERARAQHTHPGQPRPLVEATTPPPSTDGPDAGSDSGSGSEPIATEGEEHPTELESTAPLLDRPHHPEDAKPGRRSLEEIATVGFEPGPLERRLQSYLPLFKRLAGKFADRLPLPLGFDFAFVKQWNKQLFTSNQITFRDRTFNVPSDDFSQLRNDSTSFVGVLDAWILPFLNIYGVAGYTTGELDFSVTLPEFGNLSLDVDKKFHGYTAGGGGLVGGAYNNFFGLVDVTYVTSDLNIFTENVETFAVAPRIGYEHVLGRLKGAISVGANYYRQSTLRASTFEFGDETIDIDFRVAEKNPWNGAVALRAVLFHRFDVAVSGGFGSRRALIARAGFRF